MADPPARGVASQGRLNATGDREVVYCHQCGHEWYRQEEDLMCPACSGEVTEIITPETDPRPAVPGNRPETPPELRSLRHHNPWQFEDDSDPEESDISEHIRHGPGGSIFITQTIRSSGSRRRPNIPRHEPEDVMQNFNGMLNTLLGPGIHNVQTGRSGPNELFPPTTGFSTFRLGGRGGPTITGGRYTFATSIRPRNANGPQDAPPVEDLATIIGSIFHTLGQAPVEGQQGQRGPGMPPGLHNFFASLLDPANARHGDAVYSQEALDRIISALMEQHPTSNAPGPASPDAIASLPKTKLSEKQLGPEGKGECSVCMDDVHIGDEVVELPCTHWFHEACSTAWLSEHNTCPICRKGIDPDSSSSATGNTPEDPAESSSRHHTRSRSGRSSARNEARLNSIRNLAGADAVYSSSSRRTPPSPRDDPDEYAREMPGSFSRRNSEMSESQRDSRRPSHSNHRSLESRRSSQSSSGTTNPMSWLRDRWNGNSRRHD